MVRWKRVGRLMLTIVMDFVEQACLFDQATCVSESQFSWLMRGVTQVSFWDLEKN